MRVVCILVFLSIPVDVFADWNKQDTTIEATYLILHCADWLQTRHISKNEAYFDRNLYLGKYPSTSRVDRYFFLTGLTHVVLSYYLPSTYRKIFQYFTIGIQIGCVYHNIRCGVKFEF